MLYNYFTAKIKPACAAKFSGFHTLLYIFKWDIEHTRNVFWSGRFQITFCTFLAY